MNPIFSDHTLWMTIVILTFVLLLARTLCASAPAILEALARYQRARHAPAESALSNGSAMTPSETGTVREVVGSMPAADVAARAEKAAPDAANAPAPTSASEDEPAAAFPVATTPADAAAVSRDFSPVEAAAMRAGWQAGTPSQPAKRSRHRQKAASQEALRLVQSVLDRQHRR